LACRKRARLGAAKPSRAGIGASAGPHVRFERTALPYFSDAAARGEQIAPKGGKIVEANDRDINLAVAGLILLIDAEIEALQGERPNSAKYIADRHADITEYERLHAEPESIRMAAAFKKGPETEANVVKWVKILADGGETRWKKRHDAILAKTFVMGLLLRPSPYAR
jgi:hypothetical protein